MPDRLKRYRRKDVNAALNRKFIAGKREYQLQGRIGEGAIGVVRKAADQRTGEVVAVKFLAPEPRYIDVSSIEDIHSRFKREGERGVSLDHENLVKIISYEENEGGAAFIEPGGPRNPFLVMDFILGKTLESHIRSEATSGMPFNFSRANLHIAHEIAKSLVYLHERKLVHRDVKPANVFLSSALLGSLPRYVRLGDFGVVKWGDFRASMTTGTLTTTGHQGLGTYKYMSPEQAVKPKDVTVRSDMYSFGIALFELFTNQILPSPHHIFQITQARLKRAPTSGKIYDLGYGEVPAEYEHLFTWILDMFSTSPKERPSSAQMLGRLDYLLEHSPGIES